MHANMNKFVCVTDFENEAKKKVSKQVWDYFQSGATDEITLKDNYTAFKR